MAWLRLGLEDVVVILRSLMLTGGIDGVDTYDAV
jgi:hypothetical protein